MRKINDIDVKGKKILLRVDLNSPIENGKIVLNPRIRRHSRTIKELSEKGAKVIILAHQGRKGKNDFGGLEQHSKILQELIGKEVKFISDIFGENAIPNMKEGDVVLLENVRMIEDENDENPYEASIVKKLSPITDCFVLDAFSISHRKQASIVGFTKAMKCYFGPVLSREIEAIEKIRHAEKVTFFFGGAKVDDSMGILSEWLGKGHVKKVLLGGVDATLFLHAKGYNVGKSIEFLREHDLLQFTEHAKEMMEKFSEKIVIPVDVGLNINGKRVECDADKITEGEIFDIGEKTIEKYGEILKNSHTIVMNGPAGVYEMKDFEKGTFAVLHAIAKANAFSLLGGGHTITAIDKSGLDRKKFGYISLAGKALIQSLSGKEMVAVRALRENEEFFK